LGTKTPAKAIINILKKAFDLSLIKTDIEKIEFLRYLNSNNENILCKLGIEKEKKCLDNNDNLIFFQTLNNDTFTRNYCALCIDKNEELDESKYTKLQHLINNNIDKNNNLYIVIGGGYSYDFYLPNFIKEYLKRNPSERYTILIYGYDYHPIENFSYKTVCNLIQRIKLENLEIIEQIEFIHIYCLFKIPVFNSKLFSEMLNIIIKPLKNNILYLGISSCGLIIFHLLKNLFMKFCKMILGIY